MFDSIKSNRAGQLITLISLILIAALWLGAKVPAAKSGTLMASAENFGNIFLSKVTLLEPSHPSLLIRIGIHFINWLISIANGVVVGVAFAACFILFFRYWHLHAHVEQHYFNVLKGTVLGMPLGLCINCATPVAEGILAAGYSGEVALAILFSSPLLNILVLIASFTLLPNALATLRVIDVVVLLVCIPWILRWFGSLSIKNEKVCLKSDMWQGILPKLRVTEQEASWLKLLKNFALDYAQHFYVFLKKLVPVIIVAGLIGAIIIEITDWRQLLLFRDLKASTSTNYTLIILLPFIASILPLTMGLDIVLSFSLLQLNVAPHFVAAMLFPFGAFSIAAFLSLKRLFSLRFAMICYIFISLIGSINGYLYFWLIKT